MKIYNLYYGNHICNSIILTIMKKYKYFTITVLFLISTTIAIIESPNEALSSQKKSLSSQVYIDPNGFFEVFPPSGWRVQEFHQDPRGKVAFIHPDINNLNLLIIAQASAYDSLEELFKYIEAQIKKMQSRYNARMSIQRTTLGAAPALMIKVIQPGQSKLLQFQFLKEGMHYRIGYTAPINVYEDFLPIAKQCIETFKPLSKVVTKKDIVQHSISSKVRQITLLIQEGKLEDALETVNEGLQIDPSNSKLKELKNLIEKRKK